MLSKREVGALLWVQIYVGGDIGLVRQVAVQKFGLVVLFGVQMGGTDERDHCIDETQGSGTNEPGRV